MMRQHGAEKQHQLIALNQQCRKVINVPVLDTGVFVFDIDPDEAHVGIAGLQLAKSFLILAASAAPGGTKTYNKKFALQRRQLLGLGHQDR